MTEAEIAKLASWLAKVGHPKEDGQTALVEGFCKRAVAAGLPLARAMVLSTRSIPSMRDAPFAGKKKPDATVTEYGRTTEGEAAERWRRAPLPAPDEGKSPRAGAYRRDRTGISFLREFREA